MAEPNPKDIENAAYRASVAAKMQAEYDAVRSLSDAAFGPGWVPSGRNFLVDKDEEELARKEQRAPVASATVFTVRYAGQRRHFTVVDGQAVECASVDAGFGDMLKERHPTRRIEIGGQEVTPLRYSLCWAAIETYSPRNAEELAAARLRRQAKAVERDAEEMPLFAEQIRAEGYQPRTR